MNDLSARLKDLIELSSHVRFYVPSTVDVSIGADTSKVMDLNQSLEKTGPLMAPSLQGYQGGPSPDYA
jgi:hypothetical protein